MQKIKTTTTYTSGAWTLLLGLPKVQAPNDMAYAIMKASYQITPVGRLEPGAPSPLLHDPQESATPFFPGSDFFLRKPAVDLFIIGSVFTPEAQPLPSMMASVAVGNQTSELVATGVRIAERDVNGHVQFSEPEPFTEVTLSYKLAYGGIDRRLTVPEDSPLRWLVDMETDWPGLYPRNPLGRGYYVNPLPLHEVSLPQLEWPGQRLKPDALFIKDPTLWYLQPQPAGFSPTHPLMFPRYLFFDGTAEPWFPAPEDHRLLEVAQGQLPENYSGWRALHGEDSWPMPTFFQEGASGLIFDRLDPGCPVQLQGMHPNLPVLHFKIPPPPVAHLAFEHHRLEDHVRLLHLCAYPEELRVTFTYALTAPLPRRIIPEVHRHIPLSLTFQGDKFLFEPPPVRPLTGMD